MIYIFNVSQLLSDTSLGLERLFSRVTLLSGICAFCLFFMSPSLHSATCRAEDSGVSSKPPIVMIVLDDLFDYRKSRRRFGVEIQTPNLDRLAARGTTFGNAFCSIAVCNASRSSVFSGLSPIKTQIHQPEPTHFFDTLTAENTLMSRMQDAGYRVFGTGKVMHTSSRGSDRQMMEQIHDEFFQAPGRLRLPAGRVASIQAEGVLSADDRHVAWAADQLRNWDGQGDPLFLSVGIIRPHYPFIAPQEYFDLYDRASIRLPGLPEEDLSDVSLFYQLFRLLSNFHHYLVNNDLDKEFIHGYLASTSYADAKVGEILDAIDSNPALADARILLWSDNGYELGDKFTWNKFTLWESSAKVPLIVVDPSLPTGRTIGHSVSLLDVAPTVLEWAGQSIPEEFDGISLLETAENRFQLDRRSVLTTMLGSCSLRRRDMRLNLYPDGSIELYHMRRDPNQRTNLASLSQWQPVVESMKSAIAQEITRQGGIMDPDATEITGTSGDDVMFLVGEQIASGGRGNDTYFVADGFANERANEGDDVAFFANTDYTVPENVETASTYPFLNILSGPPIWNVSGNFQDNTILVFGAQGEVHGMAGSDVITSRGARDRLYGDNGRDEIHAGANNDILNGGQGADQLFGDAGNDDLDGGTGSDQLTGGPGNDRFRFPSGEERDVVTDFTFGEDTIWLHSETNIHGLSPLQITDYLIPVGNNVLIIDNANSRMLIQNATILQVRNSFEHE